MIHKVTQKNKSFDQRLILKPEILYNNVRRLIKDPDLRNYHQSAVETYMRDHFSHTRWEFSLPSGHGNETYFVKHGDNAFFVKLGSRADIYHAIAEIGLTPPILSSGYLEDGTSIFVQKFVEGRTPNRLDFRLHLKNFAVAIDQLHHCKEVRNALPDVGTARFNTIGIHVLDHIQSRWINYKHLVPDSREMIDRAIAQLREKVKQFHGGGLVASHNDINNSNWIITPDEKIYLIDLDSMSLDDPALDIGAILWWYYPPELQKEFIEFAGYTLDEEFSARMQIRMAMHCLNIILPRENSFDAFDPELFCENLTDFNAIMAGKENPQGYND